MGTPAVPVVSPEDLVITKILAGRAKDIEDVLTERLPDLDLDYIRSMLQTLEQALAQSDLVAALEAEVGRARRLRSS